MIRIIEEQTHYVLYYTTHVRVCSAWKLSATSITTSITDFCLSLTFGTVYATGFFSVTFPGT